MSYVTPYMREALKDHVLEAVLDADQFKAFYLKRPGLGRMMSTLIIFSPEGIVLQGDLTPETNGTVSCFGYGFGWFSGQLSEHYLCSKFLQTTFVADYAMDGLKEEILRMRRERELDKDKARELWHSVYVSGDFQGPQQVYDFWMDELGQGDSEGCPGYGYEPGEAGWLCAIQQRFAELAVAFSGALEVG